MTLYKEVIYQVWTCFFLLQVDDLGHSAGKVDQRIGQISSVQDCVTSVKPVKEEKGNVRLKIYYEPKYPNKNKLDSCHSNYSYKTIPR